LSANRSGATAPKRCTLLGLLVVGTLAAFGCNPEMRNDSRLKPYQEDEFFKDGRSARPIEPGTVARGHLKVDALRYTGMVNGQPVAEIPPEVLQDFQSHGMDMRAILKRGQERFNIYCSVCHGVDGYADGPVVQRGFPKPPTYHQERLRRAPIGHFYDVATNGYGVMYGYWDRVDSNDRWAIAAYIRALQYSQAVNAADLPPEDQQYVQNPAAYDQKKQQQTGNESEHE
jgi:mono/diheme cytochrome c family protein